MPTTVRFVSELPAGASLRERSAVVVGSKESLSAAGVYDFCKYACSFQRRAPRVGSASDSARTSRAAHADAITE
jgi:hypothetical protein